MVRFSSCLLLRVDRVTVGTRRFALCKFATYKFATQEKQVSYVYEYKVGPLVS